MSFSPGDRVMFHRRYESVGIDIARWTEFIVAAVDNGWVRLENFPTPVASEYLLLIEQAQILKKFEEDITLALTYLFGAKPFFVDMLEFIANADMIAYWLEEGVLEAEYGRAGERSTVALKLSEKAYSTAVERINSSPEKPVLVVHEVDGQRHWSITSCDQVVFSDDAKKD